MSTSDEFEYDEIPVRDNVCHCERVITRGLENAIENGDFCVTCGYQLALPVSSPLTTDSFPIYEDITPLQFRHTHANIPPTYSRPRSFLPQPYLPIAQSPFYSVLEPPGSPPRNFSPDPLNRDINLQDTPPRTPSPDPLEMEELIATVNQLTNALAQQPRAQAPLIFQPSPFKGLPNDDIHDFLSKFEQFAIFNNKNAAQQLQIFPLLLTGRAHLVYDQLSDNIKGNFLLLSDAMRAEFSTIKSPILEAAQLHRQKMGIHDTVKHFYVQITDKAKQLQMTPQETLNVFVNGLHEDLRNHVLLQSPRDIATAFQYAEIKETIGSISPAATNTLLQSLIEKVNKLTPTVEAVISKPVAAAATVTSPTNPRGLTDLTTQIQELQMQVAALTDTSPMPAPLSSQIFFCFKCGQPNHYANSCPLNNTSSRPHTHYDFAEFSQNNSSYQSPLPNSGNFHHSNPPQRAVYRSNNPFRSDQPFHPYTNQRPSPRYFNNNNYNNYNNYNNSNRTGNNHSSNPFYPPKPNQHDHLHPHPNTRFSQSRFSNQQNQRYPNISVLTPKCNTFISPQSAPYIEPLFINSTTTITTTSNSINTPFIENATTSMPTPTLETTTNNLPTFTNAPVTNSLSPFPIVGNTSPNPPVTPLPSNLNIPSEGELLAMSQPCMTITGSIWDNDCSVLIDTGSSISTINATFLETLPTKPTLEAPQFPAFTNVNGDESPILGQIDAPLIIEDATFHTQFQVLQGGQYDIILGRDFLSQYEALIDVFAKTLTISPPHGEQLLSLPLGRNELAHNYEINSINTALSNVPSEELLIENPRYTKNTVVPADSNAYAQQIKVPDNIDTKVAHIPENKGRFKLFLLNFITGIIVVLVLLTCNIHPASGPADNFSLPISLITAARKPTRTVSAIPAACPQIGGAYILPFRTSFHSWKKRCIFPILSFFRASRSKRTINTTDPDLVPKVSEDFTIPLISISYVSPAALLKLKQRSKEFPFLVPPNTLNYNPD